MRLIHKDIICKSRSDRFELFLFYDCHIGKRNCEEDAIRRQVREILRREAMPDRQVAVAMGGDINDVIKPQDIRFDINEVADWILEGDAKSTRKKLNDIAKAQVDRSVEIFDPIRHLIIGNLEANHDKVVRRRYNTDTHRDFCENLGIADMTDEAIIRFRLVREVAKNSPSAVVRVYMRHGYGGGRTPGAEPNKIARMMADGVARECDVCFTGHTHTFCAPMIEPVLYIPTSGTLPEQLLSRYRFGANCGCWLLSHKVGEGTYESAACYPSRAMMTVKMVVWPFWSTKVKGRAFQIPKIELREYPIL